MLVQTLPDTLTKLAQMGEATIYEPAGDQPQQEPRHGAYQSRSLAECITNVSTPKGSLPIVKAMLTTACERNCYYCPFRAGRSKMKRLTFSPDELAQGFDTLQRAGQVDGMFLSSGIIKGTDAILHARRHGRLTELSQLRQLHIRSPEQAAPYILLDGHKPAIQLNLFS